MDNSIKYAVIDIESTGTNRYKDEITFIGVALFKELHAKPSKIFFYDRSNKNHMKRFKALCNNMKKQRLKVIWQNGKFDTLFIEYHLDIVLPISEDVMLLGTAYDLVAEHALKKMALNYLGVKDWDIDLKTKTSSDFEKVKPYLKKDLRYTWKLFCFFMEELTPEQIKLYKKLLLKGFNMYRRAERRGIPFDKKRFRKIKKKYSAIEKEKREILNQYYDINWNSAPQKQKVLFGEDYENLPIIKLTDKDAPSAGQDVMKRLAMEGHELPQKVLDWTKVNTVVKMFLNRWGEDSSYDGNIHPSFGLTNVRTGRTSCKDPNLQQVPRQSDIRSLFTSMDPDRTFFEADYSQLELRLAAHYSKDPTMLKIYKEGGDIHTATAMLLTRGREPTKEERSRAKPVNFGFLYGMQPKGFLDYAFNGYGVLFNINEAKQYREAFFTKYSRLLEWHNEMAELCEALGGVYNMFGRFRKLPDVYSSNWWKKQSAIRKGINTPVQGTGSDILIAAAIELDEFLYKEANLKVFGTIHDAVLGDFPNEDEKWIVPEIKRIMANPKILDTFEIELDVPLEADVGLGAWGSK